ncbi:queuosine precursor transporter [Mesorhizobium sp.]|uniref:queuosine precursor transporter n=1 Tax=Mesorhizobium sp. TaxID=1871066 RepID=UPI000FE9D40E|nr:queuosine precursor transporter [Mesorhizobium sp.]RWP13548.1 MAG: VUT family protein [Mesorhizobium sp.]RWP18279.1 MAG: VUT family protein [Mesorhizobium sp.]RWQ28935.1 MAG: VUT family protein [Mesorhizobium sp.]RWQ52705.1 MAG: VUT family protein [Mesorhizobium sp.]TIM14160.1 MAG: VUT family protein [Mesorhizobium sp.]
MSFFSRYLPFVAAMALVVVASNVLVQFPLQGAVGGLSLADILTWGAFTYPFSFLVTDLANRRYGPAVARRIVFVGFTAAVICSVVIPPLLFRYGLIEFEMAADRLVRIAAASGTAFLIAQLLDVTVFNRLRRQSWWRAPIVGTLVGSVFDTAVFFTVAFSAAFVFAGPNDGFALETAPLIGVLPVEAMRWVSWALGDLGVKLIIAVVALIPYRLLAARWSQPALAA